MRHFILLSIMLLSSLAAAELSVAEGFARAVVADGDRNRVNRFFERAEKGEDLTVGVLGGSITSGASCWDKRLQYHGVLLSYLQKHFPKSRFTLVNAGIGATDSEYGALRVQRDLLDKKPDIVILEFAVNDDNTLKYAESYEGVVRQILSAPGEPALLLLFMTWNTGRNAQEFQSQIGSHYGLPMISYRDAVWPEIEAGRIAWSDLSPDTVHPNELGHSHAGKLLREWFRQAYDERRPVVTPASLPAPLFTDAFQFCSLQEGEGLKPIRNQGWSFRPAEKNVPAGWVATEPGSVIEFEIEGTGILFAYWKIQKDMGIASLLIDGGEPVRIDGWFSQNWGGKRFMERLAQNLPPGQHTVRIELLNEKNPRSGGHEFRILTLGANNNRKD